MHFSGTMASARLPGKTLTAIFCIQFTLTYMQYV